MLLLKGISPLVAAVLLIAVTMTIAGALAYWASTFVSGQTALFSNQTIASDCQFLKYQVYACSYDSAQTQLNLILNNIGTVDLRNATVFFIYSNNSIVNRNLEDSVASGELKSFTIKAVDGTYSKFSVRSQACAEIAVESVCR